MNFKRIPANACKEMITRQEVILLDIRDPQSFQAGHMENAIHIEEIDIQQFITDFPDNTPLVVCCYHGNSSQSAAAYFNEQGIEEVYSLDGGYEGWY